MKNIEYFTKRLNTALKTFYQNSEYSNIYNLDVSDSNLTTIPRIIFKVTFTEDGLFQRYMFDIGFFNKILDFDQEENLRGILPIITISGFRTEQIVDTERGVFGVRYIFETIINNS